MGEDKVRQPPLWGRAVAFSGIKTNLS
jgi:hypothetical protein